MARSEGWAADRFDNFSVLAEVFGLSQWWNYFNGDTGFGTDPDKRHAWLVFCSPDRSLKHGVPASTREDWYDKGVLRKGLVVPDHGNHHLDEPHNRHCFKKRATVDSYAKYWAHRPLLESWESGFACTEPDQEWADKVRKRANDPGGGA